MNATAVDDAQRIYFYLEKSTNLDAKLTFINSFLKASNNSVYAFCYCQNLKNRRIISTRNIYILFLNFDFIQIVRNMENSLDSWNDKSQQMFGVSDMLLVVEGLKKELDNMIKSYKSVAADRDK